MSGKNQPRIFEFNWRITRNKPEAKRGYLTLKFGLNYWTCERYPRFAGLTDTQRSVIEWFGDKGQEFPSAPIFFICNSPEPYTGWTDHREHTTNQSHSKAHVRVQFLDEEKAHELIVIFYTSQSWIPKWYNESTKRVEGGYHTAPCKKTHIEWIES